MIIKIIFASVLFSFTQISIAEPLPLKYFAKHADYNSIKISPDGKYFAAAAPFNDQTILVIINRQTMKPTYAFRFQENQHVSSYYWANNERLVFTRLVRKNIAEQPVYYGQIFAGNIDGSRQQIIFGYSGGKSVTSGRTGKHRGPENSWGEIVHILPDDPKNILISARSMRTDSDVPYRIVKLNIYNSRKEEITRTPLGNSSVIFNSKGEIVFAAGTDLKGTNRTYLYENDNWKEIADDDALGNYMPFSVNKKGDKMYLSAFVDKGTEAIFEYDRNTKEIQQIFHNKTADVFG